MGRIMALEGKTFGKLLVLRFFEIRDVFKFKRSFWLCKCGCGGEAVFMGTLLTSGAVTSCGCTREWHGMTGTPEYSAYLDMKGRCYNAKNRTFIYYGQRGIKVCDRWLESFSNFYSDMGARPSPQYSLDRINNDGDYGPENCRWATKHEQMNNTRWCRQLTIDGETLNITEWAALKKIPRRIIYARLKRGWSSDDALNLPVQKRGVKYAQLH